MKRIAYWATLAALAGAITLGLAAVGEPQSAWVVCDLIGLEVCK